MDTSLCPSAATARLTVVLWMAVALADLQTSAGSDQHPLPASQRAKLRESLEQTIGEATLAVKRDAKSSDDYSRRGDAYFFLGRFEEAVADYDKMVELDASVEKSHWRRGIAYFYAGRYEQAARQFEVYDTVDRVDRENGIWRFFSQAKAHGFGKARESLLKYKKDDREPFPSVYKLFADEITPAEILDLINDAQLNDAEREKRLFYAHLYIGLNHAVRDERQPALEHLRKAVANKWAPKAGFGPSYMWHVGRLHFELLTNATAASSE